MIKHPKHPDIPEAPASLKNRSKSSKVFVKCRYFCRPNYLHIIDIYVYILEHIMKYFICSQNSTLFNPKPTELTL
jgi:hypothetical protein